MVVKRADARSAWIVGCHCSNQGMTYWAGKGAVWKSVLGILLPRRNPSRCKCLRISSAYTSVRIRMVVKVVAIAMAMPRLISWRLVRSGVIDECSV